jgi:hypothetical protein
MKPHRHAEVIKEFVNGKECEYFDSLTKHWEKIEDLGDFVFDIVRIKPEPKEDIEETVLVSYGVDGLVIFNRAIPRNLKIIFDGKTGELKSAEVIK